MKARFELKEPDKMEATLSVTMTLENWKELKEQLSDKYPAWQFGGFISDMVRQAEETFYGEKETK
jgi:hypothetical protein